MIAASIWKACRSTKAKPFLKPIPIIVKLLAERGALLGHHEISSTPIRIAGAATIR